MKPFKSNVAGMLRLVAVAVLAATIGLCCTCAATGADTLPAPARLVLSKAGRLMENKQYRQAVQTLEAFQARAPGTGGRSDSRGCRHPMVYFALGNAYLMLEEPTRAESAYRRALEQDRTMADTWMNLAGACYRQEKYAEAGRAFVRAYDANAEKMPERLFYAAASYLNAGRADRCIAVFERLLAAHQALVQPRWKETLIHALLTTDRPKRALPHIREMVQVSRGEEKIRWQEILLQQYLALDMPGTALDLARALTREYPLAARWWKALAHVHLNDSRYEQALAALTIYGWLGHPSTEEQRLMADLHLQLGIPVKAAPLYAALLKQQPDARLLQHLVTAYRRLGRPEAALQQLEAFEGQPIDFELLILKGDLLYELERYDAAARVYRRAARTADPQAGRAWLMAGYAAWQKSDLTASRAAFEHAAGFSDHKQAALLAMRRLEEFGH